MTDSPSSSAITRQRPYAEQFARGRLRRQRRASFNGADGPVRKRTPEGQIAYKAERREAWLPTQQKVPA